jgi:hypothetical protein
LIAIVALLQVGVQVTAGGWPGIEAVQVTVKVAGGDDDEDLAG